MTQQMVDPFRWNDEEWVFLGADNIYDLFDPEAFGLYPKACTTACWKGFVVEFEMEANFLYLKRLMVHTEDGIYPDINGISGKQEERGFYIYDHINLKLMSYK